MVENNDSSIIWVSPSVKRSGDGTREKPFDDIDRAIAIVKPGMTILLRAGVYSRDRTFDISGTIHQPIRIAAETGAVVEIRSACWFFYDVSDVVISGLTFNNAPGGAVSLIGACTRNRFDGLRFINCGKAGVASSTLFFGGSGGSCNVVENCRFEHEATGAAETIRVGLMVSDGDGDGGEPIIDHVFRKNYFVNYDYGVLIGTGDAPAGQYGHIVEYTTVVQCGTAGILVKCGDTTVRNNRVMKCPASGIAVAAGRASVIESNRIEDCGTGIQVNGDGHTVVNNCIVRCRGEAIGVNGETAMQERRAASNILIENNTCIDCGTVQDRDGEMRVAGVRIDNGTTAIVRRNLFSGEGKPYLCAGGAAADTRAATKLIIENIAAGGCEGIEGAAAAGVTFKNAVGDDFSNDSGWGAAGAVLTPATFDPQADAIDEANDYRCGNGALDDEESGEPPDESAETAEEAAEDFEGFMNRFYSQNVP
jgi:hypothetical protein